MMEKNHKRKYIQEESEDKNVSKILKLSETFVEMKEICDLKSLERNFDFKLTDKKAKSNIIKAANRCHFEVEAKQKSKNLKFSAGSYFFVAKQMIKECEVKFKNKTSITHEDMEIKIQEFKEGFDLDGNHFDTKIVFLVNGKKAVLHFYNTTQNVKVDGSIYIDFIQRFLEPLFLSNIKSMKTQIIDFDKSVIKTLNSSKPIKPRSVKSIRSNINQSFFSCKKCEDAFDSFSKLKRHKVTEHTNSMNASSNKSIKHSTRNNSLSEEMILCEDITLFDIENKAIEKCNLELELEKSESKVLCDLCTKSFKTEKDLEAHIQQEHCPTFKCELCKFEDVDKLVLSSHISKMHTKFVCDDCKVACLTENDLEKHIDEKHKMKEVASCEKCDFETEDIEEMERHERKNVHDVKTQNKSILDFDSKTFQCHLCKFEVNTDEKMDEHMISKHAFVKCEQCEYIAADKDIMRKHKMKHTGTYVFNCGTCEFEATKEELLENHIENKHTKQTVWWNESIPSVHFCDKCENSFKNLFVKRYHHCVQETKYACPIPQCEFLAVSLSEIVPHIQSNHVKKSEKCRKCDSTFRDKEELGTHVQVEHQLARVEIPAKEQIVIKCEECDYKCGLNIQLKKHIAKIHGQKHEYEFKYKCHICDFATDYVLNLWDHRQSTHPELTPEFSPQPQEMGFSLLAEQNMDIIQEIEQLKRDTKNSMLAFADKMKGCFEAIGMDINETFHANNSTLSDLSNKLVTKMNDIEAKFEAHIGKHENKATEEEITVKKLKKDTKKTEIKEEDEIKIDDSQTKTSKSKSSKKKSKLNIAWVGTSLSKCLDINKFEKENNANVKMIRAYSIKEDGLEYPEANFETAVAEVSKDESIDVIVLEGGSTEITNIRANDAVMDASKPVEKYKDEWFNQVEKDSTELFNIAEKAIENNPNLNVIIVKRFPRYDRSSRDITGIKSKLSIFGNQVYDQLWIKRGSPQNIHFVEFEMNCENSMNIRKLLYGDTRNSDYDGIHFRGTGAVRHFSYRAAQAIKPVLRNINPHLFQSSCTPVQHVQPQRTAVNIKRYRREVYNDAHSNCEQAQYQRREVYNDDHSNCEQARYQRRKLQQTKSYAEVVKGDFQAKTKQRNNYYNIPTSNFYAPLNY